MSSRKGCMYRDDVKYEGWTVIPPRLADGEGARDMTGIGLFHKWTQELNPDISFHKQITHISSC